ncbi:MAG: tetratricopeptide repeat protein [Cyanobacteria bacterium P01_F01_bin.143]
MTNYQTHVEIKESCSDLVSSQPDLLKLKDRAKVNLDKYISNLQVSNQAKITFPYPKLNNLGPNFIGATGGSGTRVVARIVQQGGLFLGKNRARSEDSIDLMGYLSIRNIISHWKTPISVKSYNKVLKQLEVGLEKYLADIALDQVPQAWGWKIPPSIFMLPFLHSQFPHLKCLHLIRDGRDMAYSTNQNQLEYLGPILLSPEELSWSKPLQSITLWSRLNLLTAEYGEKYLPNQYLRIRYEDLCAKPVPTIERIFDFFGLSGNVHQIAQAEVSAPTSLSRWRGQNLATIAQLNQIGESALQTFGYLSPEQLDLSQLNLEINLQPQNADLYVQKGNYYFERGDTKSAIVSYQKAIQLNPTQNSELYQNLGNAFFYQEQLPEALTAYKKFLDLEPDNAQVYFILGKIQAQQENLTEAAASYKKAIELQPSHSRFYQNLGAVLTQLGQLEEVIQIFTKAVITKPNDPMIYCELASAQLNMGDVLSGIANYHQALRLHPENSGIHCQLGNAYSRQGNLEEAISHYKKAIKLNPKFLFAYTSLGNTYSKQGNLEEAISVYQKAIEIEPNIATSYNRLGNMMMQQENYEAAMQSYRHSLEINPKQSNIYIALGDSLFKLGKLKESVTAYVEAAKLNPSDKTSVKRLKAIKRKLV